MPPSDHMLASQIITFLSVMSIEAWAPTLGAPLPTIYDPDQWTAGIAIGAAICLGGIVGDWLRHGRAAAAGRKRAAVWIVAVMAGMVVGCVGLICAVPNTDTADAAYTWGLVALSLAGVIGGQTLLQRTLPTRTPDASI